MFLNLIPLPYKVGIVALLVGMLSGYLFYRGYSYCDAQHAKANLEVVEHIREVEKIVYVKDEKSTKIALQKQKKELEKAHAEELKRLTYLAANPVDCTLSDDGLRLWNAENTRYPDPERGSESR